jgi:carboxymethylenebutenolidase
MNDRIRDPHLDSLLPKVPFTRRGFIASSVAAGFAVSVQPVCAQTMIRTDTQGLAAGDIRIPTKDGSIPGYFARPATGEKFPVVLVAPEIWGAHEHIRDVARRLAKLGYLAVVPEIYSRQGDPQKAPDIQAVLKIANAKPDTETMADFDATLAWAVKDGRGDPARVAITGFCRGGRTVWMYAAHNPSLKAGVAWYGPVTGTKNDLMPRNPLDVVADINVPVLGLYGGADQGIPNDSVDRMYGALKSMKKPSEIIIYEGMPHAFNADYRPTYRKETAEDAWRRMLEWFKKYGV